MTAPAHAHAETTKAYTTPGTYTFTVPTGVSRIHVALTGGGGGGGFATANPGSYGDGGGGGGATANCTLAVRPGDLLTITVGTGGDRSPVAAAPGRKTTISYPNAGGASASGGYGGHGRRGGLGGSGTVCDGTHVTLAVGEPGANGEGGLYGAAGAGGAPGAGVHRACPAGTGTGGKGRDAQFAPNRTDRSPGKPGCAVLTY
ncbi:glycine-rich domain-containing protein [Nonomuraea sp. NPDC005983]|uniref:glycine-rich domain-containing protein n=1 Tax=Nonomuraea sp. NPDC005983 TaxID=3155595 RepID=UPI0033A45956